VDVNIARVDVCLLVMALQHHLLKRCQCCKMNVWVRRGLSRVWLLFR